MQGEWAAGSNGHTALALRRFTGYAGLLGGLDKNSYQQSRARCGRCDARLHPLAGSSIWGCASFAHALQFDAVMVQVVTVVSPEPW